MEIQQINDFKELINDPNTQKYLTRLKELNDKIVESLNLIETLEVENKQLSLGYTFGREKVSGVVRDLTNIYRHSVTERLDHAIKDLEDIECDASTLCDMLKESTNVI